MYTTLTPAYGKDYKSKKEVQEAWDKGAEFVIASVDHPSCGMYCSKRDFNEGSSVNIRYKKLTQITTIKVKKEKNEK